MPIDLNTEETTPSNAFPGASTPHFAPHPDPAHALAAAAAETRRGLWITAAVIACILLAAIVARLLQRSTDEHQLANATQATSVPSVNVVHPSVSAATARSLFPATPRPSTTLPSTPAPADI